MDEGWHVAEMILTVQVAEKMKLDLDALIVQLARAQVNFEYPKADPTG